jgi:hypothetical protein
MRIAGNTLLLILINTTFSLAESSEIRPSLLVFHGASDASAAVALDEDLFVVADDENNALRIYHHNNPDAPVAEFDMSPFLIIDSDSPEADIEGATALDHRIYWITSHGRNKDGKIRPSRYRFFATEIKTKNQNFIIEPVGSPCQNLIPSLLKYSARHQLDLESAVRWNENLTKQQRQQLAPKNQGLNIESLCITPDGKTIYIGFRNPRPTKPSNRSPQALIVPLTNAQEVIEKSAPPVFSDPILWNLKGMGVRGMEYSSHHKTFFIIAGSHDESPSFTLYRWSGENSSPPEIVQSIPA